MIESFTLGIIMASDVDAKQGEGMDIPYDTDMEYNFLLGLVQGGTPVTFQLGTEQHFVTVREVGWTEVYGMTPDRTGLNGRLMVTLITAEM
jgi:hypothetical protein